MASYTIVMLGRQYLVDPAAFRSVHRNGWLVWEPPAGPKRGKIVRTDVVGEKADEAFTERGAPTAIEIVKSDKPNGFAFGITVGHSENNDLVLHHHQVSRFHAYFQQEKGRTLLVDAESKNGTFVDGRRLLPKKPEPLPPQAVLRFGDLQVRYFEPEQLIAWIEKQASF